MHSSYKIIRVMTSRKKIWEEHAASKGRREIPTEFWLGKREVTSRLEELGVDERAVVMELKYERRAWSGFI